MDAIPAISLPNSNGLEIVAFFRLNPKFREAGIDLGSAVADACFGGHGRRLAPVTRTVLQRAALKVARSRSKNAVVAALSRHVPLVKKTHRNLGDVSYDQQGTCDVVGMKPFAIGIGADPAGSLWIKLLRAYADRARADLNSPSNCSDPLGGCLRRSSDGLRRHCPSGSPRNEKNSCEAGLQCHSK
jgi:hypothetical protein